MFLTLVIASTLGCLVAATLESGHGHDARALTEATSRTPRDVETVERIIRKAESREISSSVPMASFPEFPAEEPETPQAPVEVRPSDARAVALFCDSLDLVERPDLADDMVKLASAAYGTPSGLLNGIWHTESHHGINGQTGTCSVMGQYAIRDCWFPGTDTRRPEGCTSPYVFAGESPSETRWKRPARRVGKGTVQKRAITRIAKALGISPWSIKGSCGRSRLDGRPSHRPTFGGCFGNMQITPSEWEDDVLEMGFRLDELSPFNICDSLLVSSYRLKEHHDQRLAKYAKSASRGTVRTEADQLSWLWAGRRYYGNPDGWSSNKYERIFKYGRPGSSFRCGWDCWDRMSASGDFSLLTDYIRKRGARVRRSRRYADN